MQVSVIYLPLIAVATICRDASQPCTWVRLLQAMSSDKFLAAMQSLVQPRIHGDLHTGPASLNSVQVVSQSAGIQIIP